MATLIISITVLASLLGMYRCGVPIPERPPGFVYRESEVNASAPIHMEAYIDLMCQDAKAAFPVLQQVAELYGPDKLKLSMVMFPLPYHPHAYYASAVAFLVHSLKPDKIYDFMKSVYGKYDVIETSATMDSSSNEVIRILGEIAADYGVSVDAVFSELETNKSKSKTKARNEWKYGCSRGAFGTPNIFVNGVFLTNNETWVLNDYKNVLDPMVF